IILRYLTIKERNVREKIRVIFTGPSILSEEIKKLNVRNSSIYITDLSLNIRNSEKTIELVKNVKEMGNKIIWIDHHQWRDEYKEILGKEIDSLIVNGISSAARIVYEKFMKDDEISRKIAEYADDIDTLTDRFEESFILRALSFKKDWQEKLLDKFYKGVFWDEEISKEAEEIKERVSIDLEKTFKKVKIFETKGGLRFGFIDLRKVKTPKSWLARKAAEKFDLDFMIILRKDDAISVYIGNRKKNINLLKVAEKFGGGGHTFACGFKVKLSLKSKIINYITLKRMVPREVEEAINTVIGIM
ncbi:MAG: hypothetical protein QXX09_02335, partial [Candidatus Methanomethylicia archaeon]